jgi:hypothetical protein
MAKQPSNGPLIAGIGIALLLLLGANIMAQKANPEIAQKEAEAKEQEEAKKNPPASPSASSPASAGANELVSLGDRATFGKKDGATKIVVGFEWTPAVQGNPGLIYDAVSHLKGMAQNASIEVVNVDQHPEVTPGIGVNGKTVVPLKSDGSLDMEGNNMQELMSAMHAH